MLGRIWLGSRTVLRLASHMRRQADSSPEPNHQRAISERVSPSTTWYHWNQSWRPARASGADGACTSSSAIMVLLLSRGFAVRGRYQNHENYPGSDSR